MRSTGQFPRVGLPLPGPGRPLLRPLSCAVDAASQPGSLSQLGLRQEARLPERALAHRTSALLDPRRDHAAGNRAHTAFEEGSSGRCKVGLKQALEGACEI